ncbi:MAG: ribonuclease R [Syntrophorhabdaceae bacterium]|nr:ribonuclease R [Syntrophorhabdaceae bacterium]
MKKNRHNISPDFDEKVLTRILAQEGRPLSLNELIDRLRISRKYRKELKRFLGDLNEKGSVMRLKSGSFGIPREMNLMAGTLWCTKSGNGFVIPDKAQEKDVFIPARFIKEALHGDRVIARIEHTSRGRKEGKIIKVTKRGMRNIVGFIQQQKGQLYVIPEDERVSQRFIVGTYPKNKEMHDGDIVAARITKFPEEWKNPECAVVKSLKGLDSTQSITQFVEYKYNLPLRFRQKTESEAKALRLGDEIEDGRIDLRKLRHVTIDGEYAKDFDDAVCIDKIKGGYTLYVSIADVSHYVRPSSDIDREAYERGTSVYFPGKVLPMIPKALSNILCSLNPDEDRLAVTAAMHFSKDGSLVKSTFQKSIIRSIRRLTYNQVEEALNGNTKTQAQLADIMPDLEHMKELASALREKRTQRGTLDFDLPEPEVILDIEGGIKNILRSQRLFSHQIIEEFMIAANEAVASYLFRKKLPAIYRIHEPPDKEKLRDFEKLLYTLPVNRQCKDRRFFLSQILENVHGTDYEFFINRVLLRSMKQAKYSPVNKGHFGLASDCYLHFTSPIRRYPDLVCHRVLKSTFNGGHRYSEEELGEMALHLSERERVAMEAERELEDRIRILFMKDKLGEVYEGIIAHITSFGFFVELLDIFVEGVVLLSDLRSDYFIFQEEKFRLIGRRTKKIFRIGDRVKIKVILADVEHKRLHFELI